MPIIRNMSIGISELSFFYEIIFVYHSYKFIFTKLKLFLKFINPQNYLISPKSFKNYQLKICAGFSRIDYF